MSACRAPKNVWPGLFLAGNQGNHQNFDPFLLTNKLWLVFMGMKQFFFLEEKISKWATQKQVIFQNRQFSIFFVKISWSSPWVSRIHWCEGHWYGSTYMAVRLSDISSKTGQKCIFCVFWPFLSLCRTASWPYRLSHTIALRINEFY